MKSAATEHARKLEPGIKTRRVFSLLEVLLSLAIFLAAFVALSQLSSSGMRTAVAARLETKAIMRCESKLAEIVAAVEPLEAVTDQPFEDDVNWTWSMETAVGPHADLQNVTVTVRYNAENQQAGTSYSISRLIRDPIVFELAAAAAAAEEEAALEGEGL